MSKREVYVPDVLRLLANAIEREKMADRPQGKWIIHSNGKMCDCSACNESYDRTFEYVDEWNFCPNCGARMKGTDDGI